jgi:hypothetical protein
MVAALGSSMPEPGKLPDVQIDRNSAAIRIQIAWRKHYSHSETTNLVPYFLFRRTKKIIELNSVNFYLMAVYKDSAQERCPEGMKIASSGKGLTIFLGKRIVLKYAGNEKLAEARVRNAWKARQICREGQYQNLRIAKARTFGRYVIEDKLRIGDLDYKGRVALYTANPILFNQAVKEFMGLICQHGLKSLVRDGEVKIGRYSNVVPFIENNRGIIALVDFERCDPDFKRPERWCRFKCQDAVRLFPLHVDAILEVAERYAPGVAAANRDELQVISRQVIDYFRLKEWIQ